MDAERVNVILEQFSAVRSSDGYKQRMGALQATRDLSALPITTEELRTEPDDDRLIARVYQRIVGQSGDTEPFGAAISDATQRALVVTTWFEAETFNGGLSQYVMNQYDAVEEALALVIDGYNLMDIKDMATIATRILGIVREARDLRSRLRRTARDAWPSYDELTSLRRLDGEVRDTAADRAAFIRYYAESFAD